MIIYSYLDPAKYLKDWIESQRGVVTGIQSRLAEAAKCQPAYLSQVLKERATLSPEQAEALSRFLGHNQNENEYFILITMLQRAGTPELRSYFKKKIEELRQHNVNLKKRVAQSAKKFEIPEKVLTGYYQSWLVAAVHVALGCPELRTKASLAAYFEVSETRIAEILNFLEESGLAGKKGSYWEVRPFVYHLGKGSIHLMSHLKNGHLCALNHLEKSSKDTDLNYNVYVTISKEDAYKIKTLLADAVAQMIKVVEPSKDETVYAFNTSFFELGHAN
jgi:uncharacterized protein (TIGR02147 family)